MAYRVTISPITHENIDEAIGYYNDKVGIEIAEAFYQDLQNCYKDLEINPFHQIRVKKYRAVPLSKGCAFGVLCS